MLSGSYWKLRMIVLACFYLYEVCNLSVSGEQDKSPRYRVLDLGPTVGRTLTNTPGLNNLGDAAVWLSSNGNDASGVFFRGNRPVALQGLGAFSIVFPADVDDKGTIVGLLQEPKDLRFTRAFRWSNGVLTLLPSLAGQYSSATSLNLYGNIVGKSQVTGGAFHATVWRLNIPHDLGTLGNGDYSAALDINKQGYIVGEANILPHGSPHAFIWGNGKLRQLIDLPRSTLCSAQAISDRVDIVGACDTSHGGTRGVLWRDGKVIELGTLGEDDDSNSTALDINNNAQVVGYSEITDGKLRAFLWEDGCIDDLNALIPADSGWLLLAALRINDTGTILGRGFYHQRIHLFLLVPNNH